MDKILVAIVDDNASIRSSVRRLLTHHPKVELVGEGVNGVEALRLVESHHIDVMILDMDMPVMNGVEVLIRLQKMGMPVKVVVLSVYDDRLFIQSILEHGAIDYVSKEEGPQRILSAVLNAGSQQIPKRGAFARSYVTE